jgi:hypothetical protein
MINTWPFTPIENLLSVQRIPHKDSLLIAYFPMTGGHLLANILSCSEKYFGPDFFNKLDEIYSAEAPNIPKFAWRKAYEGKFHKNITAAHPRFFSFNEWLNFEKLIYIDWDLSNEKETKWLLFRRNFVESSGSDDNMVDAQIKYEKELIRFLDEKNKNYFKFPHSAFLNGNKFTIEINKSLEFFNLNPLNKDRIYNVWKNWWKANHKMGAKSNQVGFNEIEEDINNW